MTLTLERKGKDARDVLNCPLVIHIGHLGVVTWIWGQRREIG